MAQDPRLLSAEALAYLGDGVLELMVRSKLVREGISHSRKLNRLAQEYVTAPRQAEATERILPHLTEEEQAAFRRGRNMSHSNVPKNATRSQYCVASGLEALFGHLYLAGETDRMETLFRMAYPEEEEKGEN